MRLVSSCALFSNNYVPAYVIAVDADQSWRDRAITIMQAFSLCPVYHVDRRTGLTAKAATWLAESSSGRVSDLFTSDRGHARDAETTYAHLSAWIHAVNSASPMNMAIFVEEDLELWVQPSMFHQVLASFASAATSPSLELPLSALMLGGCWGLHAGQERAPIATLADGTTLLTPSRACFKWWQIPSGIRKASPNLDTFRTGHGGNAGKTCVEDWAARCVSFYGLTLNGAERMLAISDGLPYGIHPADHHINGIFAAGPKRQLDVAFVEPPVACQVRGLNGSRLCFQRCPPPEMRRPVRFGSPLQRELGVAPCAELRVPYPSWGDGQALEPIPNASIGTTVGSHPAASTLVRQLAPQPASPQATLAKPGRRGASDAVVYASLLQTRSSCARPSEETLPWIQRETPTDRPIALNLNSDDSALFLAGATGNTFERREIGRRHVGPIFFRSRIRPVKVASARVLSHSGDSGSTNQGGSNAAVCRAARPSIYVPIWKAASSSLLLSVLPSLYPGRDAVWGPHASLSQEPAPVRTVHVGEREYSFETGPMSTSPLPPAEVIFTVVRDPLARFVSAFRPHDKGLPLCDGRACNKTLRLLDDHARMLEHGPRHWLRQPEGGYGSWAHWLSQTFFLSGTGGAQVQQRINFTHVLRLETLTEDLDELAKALGAQDGCRVELDAVSDARGLIHARRSGDSSHAIYVHELMTSAPQTVCRVCRIYQADYECLGYPLPNACQQTACLREPPSPAASTATAPLERADAPPALTDRSESTKVPKEVEAAPSTGAPSSSSSYAAGGGAAAAPQNGVCSSASSEAPLPFSAAAIRTCVDADPWLRLYACSTCLSPECRSGRLSARENATCTRTAVALANLTVAFVGDSLMAHVLTLANCVLPGVQGRWPSFALNVIPHQRETLATMLREVLDSADLVIFNVGAWYNWDAGEPEEGFTAAGPAFTEEGWGFVAGRSQRLMEACIARRLPAPTMELERVCQSQACLHSPSTNRERVGYAFRRRKCKDSLGRQAYVSDLSLFASTLRSVSREKSWRARRLIWRASEPQHYNTPSGMFPRQRSPFWPSGNGKCVAIRNFELSQERNIVAERVFGPLLDVVGAPHLEIWSTARRDARAHDQHAEKRGGMMHGDCTHFCLHSEVGRNWLEELLDLLQQ